MEFDDGRSPARVVNDRIYVAVGRDVQESKSTLSWALENFGADFRIIHVHQPHQLNPSPRPFHGSRSRDPQELASQQMDSILDEYIHMCSQAEVHAEKRFIEMQDIGEGIVELVEQHAITKLVMGAAADRRYFEGMTLTSTKAKFVNQHAQRSCSIWFVCHGHRIYLREGDSNTSDVGITPSVSQGSSVAESGLQNVRSPLGSVHSRSNSSEVEDDLPSVRYERGEGSNYTSESNSARAYEGSSQNQRYTGMLKALENIHNEELRVRKYLEESLALQKEAFEALKNRHEELEMLYGDALKANSEILANQTSEPSGAHGQDFISEFSGYELEAALQIEEGEYGTTFRGSLHHTQVVIKMMQPRNYRQAVRRVTKLRHPNLVTLIGVSPDTPALIYEYPPNGSLEDQLGARDTSNHLSWQTRICICADTCAALMFLHSCHGMVHGDLKPGNILLDSNFTAKIANFGLHSAPSHPPSTGELSFASDVYSFGYVLLRLLTGRSALNLDEVMQNALDGENLSGLLDPTAGHWPFEQATELAHLALSCRDIDSDNRPDLASRVWPVLERMRTEASLSSRSGPEEPSEPPEHFLCPISYEIMRDPHVAADGFTYEASEIRRWLNDGHDTSPMTNNPLSTLDLFPNQALRSMIQEWRQRHNL
ncbi:U-box domain-containing protein 33-like [Eucalyptus grandis]|uniref:U-box domain-containing protein 33-like n=1 Tax=Eucalyptus grandis TaxID=71139 RepID=UPI00192EF6E5|nr:U-box domain-containing protein 33-like [Eucalyptus grandis]